MRILTVGRGHARPLWHGHPWVHARSVVGERRDDVASDDDVVRVDDEEGRVIGHGFESPGSALRVRLLTWGAARPDVEALLAARVEAAVLLRQRLFPDADVTSTYRLVHAEGDRLPGLVVDRYGDVLVAQWATAAMAARRELLARQLLRTSGARTLVSRPAGYEAEEGIDEVSGAPVFELGAPCPERIEVLEAGMRLVVEPRVGQKTGHFVDQRENRLRVAELCAGRSVLDLYAGTGGFSVQALRAGADSSIAVDVSERSIARAHEHAELAGVADRFEAHAVDVREAMTLLRDQRRRFDVVVVDPPSFFPKRGEARAAWKAYRELNVKALGRVAAAGGVLATFVCSARMSASELLETVRSAARDCRRSFRVVRALEAGPDHPRAGDGDVGRYLAGWLLAVDPDEELT
ncbi:MAG: class I SAM-dependent rRNA methyltransferase [Planctomycetes bacterium]|nr:class I SAM-dependent rRNA methyltransferase [Planctomycetota bacterium]MCB9830345.1 class I SAM-dependent rRNA methyltransferase [Planctomycetota bacterium]MCB9900645.1 class I SAM-dependent rRNA methyltransferase [Planctomycetota bacterium]